MEEITWHSLVNRLACTSLKRLNKEEFDDFLWQANIRGKTEDLEKVLKSKKKKSRYIWNLDNLIKKGYTGSGDFTSVERQLLEVLNLEALIELIIRETQRFGVYFAPHHFSYYQKSLNNLKVLLYSGDRAGFEDYAKRYLRAPKMLCPKLRFIEILEDDPKYAFCWAKYINLKRRAPKFILKGRKLYKSDAETFIKKMNGELTDNCVIEKITAFGAQYKLINVASVDALNKFLSEYFIESKPNILGIDVETIFGENKVALIQLATKDWVAILDVHQISQQIKDSDWIKVFRRIFDPEITRVAFAFASDYYVIGNTFPDTKPLMQEEARKGLCIKKLVDEIRKNAAIENAVFSGRKPATASLRNVTEALLGIELEKDEQLSDWTVRPLTDRQKIYAAKDAIVVLLLKDKIEAALKSKLGSDAAARIIEQAYVPMKAEKSVDGLAENLQKVALGRN